MTGTTGTTGPGLWSPAFTTACARGVARLRNGFARVRRRLRNAVRGEAGMSTAEYAIGTLAAAGFASLLYAVVTSDAVREALTSLVQRALEGSV